MLVRLEVGEASESLDGAVSVLRFVQLLGLFEGVPPRFAGCGYRMACPVAPDRVRWVICCRRVCEA